MDTLILVVFHYKGQPPAFILPSRAVLREARIIKRYDKTQEISLEEAAAIVAGNYNMVFAIAD